MVFYIKLSSKNKENLESLTRFLIKTKFIKANLKILNGLKSKKFITVLKSPHINKTAQTQFEFRIYSKKILIYSFKPYLVINLIKKIRDTNFPGVKIKIKVAFKKQKIKTLLSNIEPDKLNINFLHSILDRKIQEKYKIKKYIQLLSYYGKLSV